MRGLPKLGDSHTVGVAMNDFHFIHHSWIHGSVCHTIMHKIKMFALGQIPGSGHMHSSSNYSSHGPWFAVTCNINDGDCRDPSYPFISSRPSHCWHIEPVCYKRVGFDSWGTLRISWAGVIEYISLRIVQAQGTPTSGSVPFHNSLALHHLSRPYSACGGHGVRRDWDCSVF